MAPISDIHPLDAGAKLEHPEPDSPLGKALQTAQAGSRERLRKTFPPEFVVDNPQAPPPTKPVVGHLRGDLLERLDPWSLLEDGVTRWLRSDWEAPIGMAVEASGRPDASDDLFPAPLGHDPLPSRSVGRLVSTLDDGYLLALHGCEDRSGSLQILLEDLERSLDVAALTTLIFGVRTALGAPPEPSPFDRIMIQLVGERHVAMSTGNDHGGGIGVKPGQILRVPAGWIARHSPQDMDTMHVEVSLCTPHLESDGAPLKATNPSQELHSRAKWSAWLPARCVANVQDLTQVLVNQRWDETAIRMCLPGGLFLSQTRAGQQYAAGGFRFAATPSAVEQIARLLTGAVHSGDSFDREVLESLLRMGFIEVSTS